MVWIGFGIVWLGYGTTLWGVALISGKDLSPRQIWSPFHYYAGKWSAIPKAGNEVIIPLGGKGDTAMATLTVANAPAGTAATSGGASGPAQPARIASAATIRAVAATHGWDHGTQWNALTHVIAAESGGSPTAHNPGGALGIAQALGHGTSCSGGTLGNEYGPQYGLTCKQARAANSGDAIQQLRWMMGYIAATYGTPANAWQHEVQHNWY